MQKLIIVLALLPMSAFAQNTGKERVKSFEFHCDTIELNMRNISSTGKIISTTRVTVPDPSVLHVDAAGSSATAITQEATSTTIPSYMTGYGVTVVCPAFPDLLADKAEYDYTSQKVTLTGHITVVDHGVKKEIGSTATLDFHGDPYRIESLR